MSDLQMHSRKTEFAEKMQEPQAGPDHNLSGTLLWIKTG